MDKGNINQVSHDGWASFIDIIQEVVLDQVNEWRTESQENPTCVQDLDQYKKWGQIFLHMMHQKEESILEN